MGENNEKKRIGRRAVFGGAAILLLTWAFYHIVNRLGSDAELLKLGIDLFGVYAPVVLGVIGFIFSGLTATDIFVKGKKG